MPTRATFVSACIFQACLLASNAFVLQVPKAVAPVALNAFSYGNPNVETKTPTSQTAAPFAAKETTDATNLAVKKGSKPKAPARDVWESPAAMKVQGGSLRTWSLVDQSVDKVQVYMKTEGRPLNADLELWQGPDNTPLKLAVYVEDGELRPFSAVIDTPSSQNAVAIRNTGYIEFPMDAVLTSGVEDTLPSQVPTGKIVQGGAVYSTPFDPSVSSVLVALKTDGRPLNARIELLQGPNNRKQVMELYTEDGLDRPFMAVLQTPGAGNVVRIVNTSPIEFPLTAAVEAYRVVDNLSNNDGDTFIVN